MTITYHTLPSGNITDANSYQGQLYLALCQMECIGGIPNMTIYDDGKADSVDKNGNTILGHNPTIGVGFNLRAQLLPVMQAYFSQLNPNFDDPNNSSTYTKDKQLITNLTAIMAESWDGQVDARNTEVVKAIKDYYVSIGNSKQITSFFLTTDQIQSAFIKISKTFEDELINYTTAPDSQERIALMSLAWNGPSGPLQKKSLLGPGLKAALDSGDCAKAWFEIRYVSNGDANDGIAKRRYFESQLFGLYNESAGASIPLDEATQTCAMLSGSTSSTTNRNTVFSYEAKYGDADVAAANTDYHDVLGLTVQTLAQALQPAANTLNASLNDKVENPYYSNTAAFNPLDIQVATTGGSNHLVASHRDGYNLAPGGNDTNAHDYSSLLIAQGGNDTLDDSASSVNDVLIGGSGTGKDKGNDTFYVGSGNDYIVAGTGNALIEGGPGGGAIGGGNDTIVLGPANAPWKGGDDTVWGGSGNDVYYLSLQSQISHIHLGSGHSTINVVYSPTDIAALGIDATSLGSDPFSTVSSGESLYEDETHHELIISTLNPDGTKHLEIIDLSPPVASTSSQAPLTPKIECRCRHRHNGHDRRDHHRRLYRQQSFRHTTHERPDPDDSIQQPLAT